MSPFASPLSAITRVPDPTVVGSIALRKDPQGFCLHCHDRHRALMLRLPLVGNQNLMIMIRPVICSYIERYKLSMEFHIGSVIGIGI